MPSLDSKDIEGTLEALVDIYGLARIIDTLGDICGAKAEHIRANWQDEGAAKTWDDAGRAMIRANNDKRVQAVSMGALR